MLQPCECENESHMAKDKRTPNGNPGHSYGITFFTLKPIKTNYGTFKVCLDCAEDCAEKYRKT